MIRSPPPLAHMPGRLWQGLAAIRGMQNTLFLCLVLDRKRSCHFCQIRFTSAWWTWPSLRIRFTVFSHAILTLVGLFSLETLTIPSALVVGTLRLRSRLHWVGGSGYLPIRTCFDRLVPKREITERAARALVLILVLMIG
jgi:hypothetical protein